MYESVFRKTSICILFLMLALFCYGCSQITASKETSDSVETTTESSLISETETTPSQTTEVLTTLNHVPNENSKLIKKETFKVLNGNLIPYECSEYEYNEQGLLVYYKWSNLNNLNIYMYEYDQLGRAISQTTYNSEDMSDSPYIEEYYYNESGLMEKKVTTAEDASGLIQWTVSYTYNEDGLLLKADENGTTYSVKYNEKGNPVRVQGYGDWEYYYDENDQLTKIVETWTFFDSGEQVAVLFEPSTISDYNDIEVDILIDTDPIYATELGPIYGFKQVKSECIYSYSTHWDKYGEHTDYFYNSEDTSYIYDEEDHLIKEIHNYIDNLPMADGFEYNYSETTYEYSEYGELIREKQECIDRFGDVVYSIEYAYEYTYE